MATMEQIFVRGPVQDPAARESEVPFACPVDPDGWGHLVALVRANDPDGMERLYALFSRGIRFVLWHHLGAENLDDHVHDAFLVVVQAIQRGDLRDPDRLLGFIHTIVRRHIAHQIRGNVAERRSRVEWEPVAGVLHDARPDPERALQHEEECAIMRRVLQEMPPRDREVLTRFYLLEESVESICRELELSETQFRLLKSRAKARFAEAGKKRMQHLSLASYLRTRLFGRGA